MKNDKTKLTAFVLIALIVICGGSFMAVRSLNNQTFATTAANYTTVFTEGTTSAGLSADVTEATAGIPSTLAPATTKGEEITTTQEETEASDIYTTANPFTTFANAASTGKEEKEETSEVTTTAPATTLQTLPTTPVTTTPNNESDELVQNAAVFSDGFLGFKYNADGKYYFTSDDPWQRNFGFNQLYDVGAAMAVMYYDTFRCKFTYDERDWMIQFWKGQYGFLFLGWEIGVYNKPIDRTAEHYDCATDEDSLMMSMAGYRKGEEMFTRDYAKYWWCTGFVPGKLDSFSDRSELSLNARITMKDVKMLLSFCGALKENGFVLNQDYTTSGLDVYITW